MTRGSRSDVASSFTIVKGALIEETYAVFARWDWHRSKAENLARLSDTNVIAARSAAWLRDVRKVLNRRFDPEGRDRPLVVLAQHGCEIEKWKPLLLWHSTKDEFLMRDFFVNWLFPIYDTGAVRLRSEDLLPYLATLGQRGARVEHEWAEVTARRVADALLSIARDFGILEGRVVKEFASYHLPEFSFLYLVHALYAERHNARRLVNADDWRMFLMRPSGVEDELLRLHQYRKLDYQVAGSLAQLSLPYSGPLEYAERMVA